MPKHIVSELPKNHNPNDGHPSRPLGMWGVLRARRRACLSRPRGSTSPAQRVILRLDTQRHSRLESPHVSSVLSDWTRGTDVAFPADLFLLWIWKGKRQRRLFARNPYTLDFPRSTLKIRESRSGRCGSEPERPGQNAGSPFGA
nr:hypothetical protein L204_00599 [Cryptococcus depauperatus CBS 7855]